MKRTATAILLATLVGTIIGCASTSTAVSMRGSDVSAPDMAPAAKTYEEKVPGVGTPHLIARTFVGQPPMVPHTVEKYVPLTMEENACMECHQTEEIRGQKIPQIGKSHFSQTRKNKKGQPALEMSRFQCDTCHVPQVDAKELVDNQFVGVVK